MMRRRWFCLRMREVPVRGASSVVPSEQMRVDSDIILGLGVVGGVGRLLVSVVEDEFSTKR